MKTIPENIKQKIEKLVKDLNYHCDLYYRFDSPEILDVEYDRLYTQLKNLEEEYGFILPDSPTQRVGALPLDKFDEIEHSKPMLSLGNAFSFEEVRKFDQRVKKNLNLSGDITYTVEPKYDGLAIELIYRRGILYKASTRGDGYKGEDVTQNIRTIKSIPQLIEDNDVPDEIDIRGEVYMDIDELEAINKERERRGEPVYANPRNVAAGSIKNLDSSITAKRRLNIACYGVGNLKGKSFKNQWDFIAWLKKMNFSTPLSMTLSKGVDKVIDTIKDISTKRDGFAFETDGVVIKVNDFSLQKKLGTTTHEPKWAIAYKFPAERGITQITEIQESVGKTGTITPVANLEPIRISGVTVSRSTLHNWDEVVRKDIRVGDTVEIERAGDVIPHIVKVKLDNRTGNEGKYFPYDKCSQCESKVIREEGEVAYRCVGLNCPAQVKEKIKNYASKSAMDIEGLGEKNIELLYEYGLVKHFTDIYKLEEFDLLRLPGFAEKSAHNLITAINKSKRTTLSRFILSLGIPFVGEYSSKIIAQNFKNVKALINAKSEEFKAIDQIGEKVTSSLRSFFKDNHNISALNVVSKELELSNPEYKRIEAISPKNEEDKMPFSGLTFVITGSLPKTRPEVITYIEQQGGRVLSAISRKASYLIVGEKSGSKIEKAKELGVKVISYEKLIEMAKSL